MADSQASLLEQVRSGSNRQLQMLAAEGMLPLPAEQLLGYYRKAEAASGVGGNYLAAINFVLLAVTVRPWSVQLTVVPAANGTQKPVSRTPGSNVVMGVIVGSDGAGLKTLAAPSG